MGVSQRLRRAEFFIPSENKDETLQEIVELMEQNNHTPRSKAFAYMNRVNHESWESLGEAMRDWRLPIETDADGNVVDIRFIGENAGDENDLFNAIAPYVETGSEIVFVVGSRGDRTKYTFNQDAVTVERGL